LATNSFIFSLITFKIIKLRNSKSTSEVGKFTGNRSLEPLAEIPENWFHHFSSFQAKIGLREIEEIPLRDEKRRAISLRYSKELDSVGPRGNEDGLSTYWQYISIVAQPVTFRQHLNRNGIDCATTSLVNMTKLPKYDLNLEFQKTDEIYLNGVYLPCYHQLSEAQLNRLISIIKLYRE
jgi:dTDP-4-amino-4,6-dideoxygalactose transaminase